MTEVSISEFRKNIKLYSSKVQDEDLLIVSNGKPVMRVSNPNKAKLQLLDSLRGVVPIGDENKIMESKLKEL